MSSQFTTLIQLIGYNFHKTFNVLFNMRIRVDFPVPFQIAVQFKCNSSASKRKKID